jgi:hypothetical protein
MQISISSAVARDTNLVMTLRNVNKHFWRRCWIYKPSDDVKKYQQCYNCYLYKYPL